MKATRECWPPCPKADCIMLRGKHADFVAPRLRHALRLPAAGNAGLLADSGALGPGGHRA